MARRREQDFSFHFHILNIFLQFISYTSSLPFFYGLRSSPSQIALLLLPLFVVSSVLCLLYVCRRWRENDNKSTVQLFPQPRREVTDCPRSAKRGEGMPPKHSQSIQFRWMALRTFRKVPTNEDTAGCQGKCFKLRLIFHSILWYRFKECMCGLCYFLAFVVNKVTTRSVDFCFTHKTFHRTLSVFFALKDLFSCGLYSSYLFILPLFTSFSTRRISAFLSFLSLSFRHLLCIWSS